MYARSRFEQSAAIPSVALQIRTQPLLHVLSARTRPPLSANGCRLSPLTPFLTSLTKTRLGGRESAYLTPLSASLTQALCVSPFAATLTKTHPGRHTLLHSLPSQDRTKPSPHALSTRLHLPLSANGCRLSPLVRGKAVGRGSAWLGSRQQGTRGSRKRRHHQIIRGCSKFAAEMSTGDGQRVWRRAGVCLAHDPINNEERQHGHERAGGIQQRIPWRSRPRRDERLVDFVQRRIHRGNHPGADRPRPVPPIARPANSAVQRHIKNKIFREVCAFTHEVMDQ